MPITKDDLGDLRDLARNAGFVKLRRFAMEEVTRLVGEALSAPIPPTIPRDSTDFQAWERLERWYAARTIARVFGLESNITNCNAEDSLLGRAIADATADGKPREADDDRDS